MPTGRKGELSRRSPQSRIWPRLLVLGGRRVRPRSPRNLRRHQCKRCSGSRSRSQNRRGPTPLASNRRITPRQYRSFAASRDFAIFAPLVVLVESSKADPSKIPPHARCAGCNGHSALARRFRDLLRQKRADELGGWMEESSRSGIPEELRRFAKGLNSDRSAVEAALTLPWSNGPTEGHVNRLKLIKRQMFGRAKFDLLRQRVLCAC
jgi:hypothetical protein